MDFFRNVLSMKNQKDEAGRIFRSLLLLLVIGAVINSIFLPSEDDSFFERDGVQEVFDEASLRYQGSLFWVKADGTREEVTAPGEYSVGIGETFVVETRLPEDFDKAAIITRGSCCWS